MPVRFLCGRGGFPLPPPDSIAVQVHGECVRNRVEVNFVLNLVQDNGTAAARAGSVTALAAIDLVTGPAR